MEHDTLCPYGNGGKNDSCPNCYLISKVREEEREQAAQRVRATFWPTDGSWVTEETTFDAMGKAAIAAARGEAQ